ncbi:allantoate permease [Schizosaccharomyces japonicus yFS275]|uniref:Allantoate permease n=1 Tax=Schizosaccharomyces japonicus (strain yFS275 / FY16936) TaxID=402676 RepID=B6K6G4_SCHJY|nr:allantoate permease [Schizosaccharomyces japonicus yFS275]EEB09118.1 allantoate permease [Schizosaccharomyces japonicus yFS275]
MSSAFIVGDSAPEYSEAKSSTESKLKSGVEVHSEVDAAYELLREAESLDPITPKEEKRLKFKLYTFVFGLVFIIDLMLFIDKATLSYASILGLFEDAHINSDQYNNMNTIFYVGYIIAQWPGHCLLWEATMSMFFTLEEQALVQPIFWVSCLGSNIPAGFIAYGVQYINSSLHPWRIFMFITGGFTFFLSIWAVFYYPDNPMTAHFLTRTERIRIIVRVKESTKSSIEQKVFKKEQFYEALRDPISWLFAVQSFTLMLSNNLAYQQNLLFTSLNISNLNSTLVGVASAGFDIVCCIISTFLMSIFRSQSAIFASFWCLPAIAGGIVAVALPWSNKLGILLGIILASPFGITYIIALGWSMSSTAGYTKKLTRSAMYMIAYAVANIIGPQLWQSRDSPRYYPAWIVQIVVAWTITPIILFVIRFILARRNNERRALQAEKAEADNKMFVDAVDKNGNPIRTEIDVTMLDLTDLENKKFIYPL